jgi:hypothetical protein
MKTILLLLLLLTSLVIAQKQSYKISNLNNTNSPSAPFVAVIENNGGLIK